jgi:hypothetical protein
MKRERKREEEETTHRVSEMVGRKALEKNWQTLGGESLLCVFGACRYGGTDCEIGSRVHFPGHTVGG